MIDLTKDQIVDPPVKCWVDDKAESVWSPRWLVAIADGLYHTLNGCDHSINATLIDAFRIGTYIWEDCTLTDPTVLVKKISGWGGDMTLSCNDFKMTIGHDIEIKNLYHDIDKTHKGKGEV